MAFSYDFHIHSCLSPCGDDDMTPNNIAGMAAVKGLSIIALTDHNSCKNCPALLSIAPNYGITAIAGIELCTAEEVHVVCLFRTLEGAMDFDSYIHKHIMPVKNRPDIFGKQQIMNENDEIIGEEPLLLIGSTDISFDDVAALTKSHDGIMIFRPTLIRAATVLFPIWALYRRTAALHALRFITRQTANALRLQTLILKAAGCFAIPTLTICGISMSRTILFMLRQTMTCRQPAKLSTICPDTQNKRQPPGLPLFFKLWISQVPSQEAY